MSFWASNIWRPLGIAKGAFEKRNNTLSDKKISLEPKRIPKTNEVRVLRKCETHTTYSR